jgi:hypothetical protein
MPNTPNLPPELKNINPDTIDWRAEIEQTLAETGWTKVELATVLGLHVQHQRGRKMPVSPHFYSWLRGNHKPRAYLLYALRYLRAHYGQATPPGTTTPPNPTE